MAANPGDSPLWPGARVLVLSPTPTHPQDYGNRKRIFEVCSRLTSEGARITLVHYPAEQEWRRTLPLRAEREMIQTWAQYYTIGVTRELHQPPHGHHHGIDEWWDEAIGDFLHWLFSVQSFDAFIVNYTWLSKAFEYAPPSVFKILDTHDKFSGRREILESMGLQPEFFFTTDDEERIAFQRADLVWAIKREEQKLLERISDAPVLTMPHIDPFRALERPMPDPKGYFRVGVIGARNNINRTNIAAFLTEADPVFRETFAPIRIEIAGTVCEMLRDTDSPFVNLRGRVENVEDFYRAVDCVAIPMSASTGLKIKTGEALSLGLPVVSLAHAFEGYEPSDELHSLPDFKAMARALVGLAFAPRNRLSALAAASASAHAKTSMLIARASQDSRALLLAKQRSILLAVDSRAFVDGSIFSLVLNSTFEYLNNLGNVTVLVARGSASDVVANEAAVERLRRVIVSADLEDAPGLRTALVAIGAETRTVHGYLRSCAPRVLVLDALHPDFFGQGCRNALVISRTEMIGLSEGHAQFMVPCEGVRRAVLATPQLSADTAALMGAGPIEPLLVPCMWRNPSKRFPERVDHSNTRSAVLLGSPRSAAIAVAAAMARSWGMMPHIVLPIGDELIANEMNGEHTTCQRVDDYLLAILTGNTALPHLAVDLGGGALGLPLCREFLDRYGVPTVTTSPVGNHPAIVQGSIPLRATTEDELWETFRSFAIDTKPSTLDVFRGRATELQGDGGWAWIWRECTRLFETGDMELP